ncbi:MAG: hypothetical protein HOP11_14145 [Saprospiraceae bacterium]|nr:hypothetical protein [Saprospiraceae bacterium]
MFKFRFISAILFLFFCELLSQSFEKFYSFDNIDISSFDYKIIENENIRIIGRVGFNNKEFLLHASLDKKGDLINYCIHNDESLPHFFPSNIITSQGKYYTITNQPYISSTLVSMNSEDCNFNINKEIRSYHSPNSFFLANDFCLVTDSTYAIAIVDNKDNANFGYSTLRIDYNKLNGDTIWSRTFRKFGFYHTANEIKFIHDSLLVVASNIFKPTYNPKDPMSLSSYLLFYSITGKLIKELRVNNHYPILKDFVIIDSFIYCAGVDTMDSENEWHADVPVVWKMDYKGNIIWSKDFFGRDFIIKNGSLMHSILYDKERNLLVVAGLTAKRSILNLNYIERQHLVGILSKDGEIRDIRYLSKDTSYITDYSFDLDIDKNSIWTSGARYKNDGSSQRETQAFLMKIDWNDLNCNSNKSDDKIVIYPEYYFNQNNNKIEFKSIAKEKFEIKLYSILGAELLSKELKLLEQIESIDLNYLAAGPYIISLGKCNASHSMQSKLIFKN